jgi:ABC-type xylose transport system permease subunit
MTNLALQSVAVGTIAIGVVLVLLLGEIDLSVGSVSGLAAAVLAVLLVNQEMNLFLAIAAGILSGTAVGLFYGVIYTRFGVPSFVISLAGLLAVLGLQLQVLGEDGAINIPFSSGLVQYFQKFLPETLSYVLCVVVAAAIAGFNWFQASRRKAAGLSGRSNLDIALGASLLLLALVVPTLVFNQYRGVPVPFVVFVVMVAVTNLALQRSRWGRSVYAVGGNVEAARRAGIAVRRVYISVFMLTATFAAIGGVLAAGKLNAANQSSGTGDTNLNAIAAAVIGGTSLFGGRGSAYSALLGMLVIGSISNGLALLNLDSPVRFMITGGVLLAAVTIDSIARRTRKASGRE